MGKRKAKKSLLSARCCPTIPKGFETYANPVGCPTLEVGRYVLYMRILDGGLGLTLNANLITKVGEDVLYGALEANGHKYSVGDTVGCTFP